MIKSKGISDIITVIILLLVAVSLAGAFFIWSGRSVSTLQEGAGAQINQTSSALSQRVKIDAASGSTLVVRSIGSSPVSAGSLAIFVAGTIQTCTAWSKNPIPANDFSSCTAGFSCTSGQSVRVTTSGGEASATCT